MPSPLDAYRSPAERERTLDRLANDVGAELVAIGASGEGRPIRAVRVPAKRATTRRLLVCAGIHGPEYIGTEVAFGVLERASSSGLADVAELWVVPCLNPDGYERTWALGGVGSLHDLRSNKNHIDLNRNYPLPAPQRKVWLTFGGWRTGSDDPANPFYRGPSPASEPETAAMVALFDRVHFDASVSLHSAMGMLIPPCTAASAASYRALCAAFARAQPDVRYRRAVAGRFDVFTGEQEDFQHHAHGTWAITVEHYPAWVDVKRFFQPNLFRRFNPPDPQRWVANDVPGIAAYFRAALELPRPERETQTAR